MIVLGMGFTDHEASAALVVDGRLKTAIARERLTRLKRDGKIFGSGKLDLSVAAQYCLDENRLTLRDVGLIVWSHIDHLSAKKLTVLLALEGGMDFSGIPFLVLPHHFAHACCSYYLSPFSNAAVLVADGNGGTLDGLVNECAGPEAESVRAGSAIIQEFSGGRGGPAHELESFYHCDGPNWSTLRKVVGDCDGIGARYGAISALIFGDPLDAGKTMGLAPYGSPAAGPLFLEPRGTDEMRAFQATHGEGWSALKQQIKSWRASEPKPNYQDSLPVSFAATIQREAEDAMLSHARWLRGATGSANLCLAGGVALNCVANSYLSREAGFDAVFVPPAPGDDGIAVGCALYGAAKHGELQRDSCPVFVGRGYTCDTDEATSMGLKPVATNRDVTDWVAGRIAEGAIVAWYQRGAELGPRALGHRSFLADPRRPEMRDYLNNVIKNREPFRPFAPVVLDKAANTYFEEFYPSYFMSFVSRVRVEQRALVPAVVHVDGTARYQILRPSDNPELYQLIEAFAKQTGVAMLLNTSFNRAGEPIVETPQDAARSLLASSADYLVLNGSVYSRA